MTSYIFLDTWVLAEFTKNEELLEKLYNFIVDNDLLVIIDIYTIIEIYDTKWMLKENERGTRTAGFLSKLRCVVIDHKVVWEKVLFSNDQAPDELPIGMLFSDHTPTTMFFTLLTFLQGTKWWLNINPHLDIIKLVQEHNEGKKDWLNYVEEELLPVRNLSDVPEDIILSAIDGTLVKGLIKHKFSTSEEKALSIVSQHPVPMLLPIRCTSLAKYYTYINNDSGNNREVKESDMVDLLRMTLLPYCKYFTLDKGMKHIAKKVIKKLNLGCVLLNHSDLINLISS